METNKARFVHMDLADLKAELDAINKAIREEVILARLANRQSWAEIGRDLGMSKQAAQQKFGPYLTGRNTSRDDQYTPEENTKADEALAVLTAITDRPEPSIFLDPVEPANEFAAIFQTADWYAAYGCGECGRKDRPASCRNCGTR